MTVLPSQINEVLSLYNRVSKVKASSFLEKNQAGPQDIVSISLEGKKRQLIDRTRTEALEQRRKT